MNDNIKNFGTATTPSGQKHLIPFHQIIAIHLDKRHDGDRAFVILGSDTTSKLKHDEEFEEFLNDYTKWLEVNG